MYNFLSNFHSQYPRLYIWRTNEVEVDRSRVKTVFQHLHHRASVNTLKSRGLTDNDSLLSMGRKMTRNRFQLLMKLFHLLGNTAAKKWWEAGYDTQLILPILHLHKIQAVQHRPLGYVAGIHLSSRTFFRISVLGQTNPWDNSIVFCLRKYQLLWTEGWSHDESKWTTWNHGRDLR